jgi:hypothetical protein
MTRRADRTRHQPAERDRRGIGTAYSLDTLDGARPLAVAHRTSRRDDDLFAGLVGRWSARPARPARPAGSGRAGFRFGLTVLVRGGFAVILAALAVATGLDGRVTAFVAGYALVLSVLAPVLATRAERIARPFGCRPSDIVPTGGVR